MAKIEPLIKKLVIILIIILILFLGNLSYLYGSVFRSSERIHRFNILTVNLDNGVISESLIQAYDGLKSPTFPTLHFVDASEFDSSPNLIREEVVNGHYWAAIYTNANASNRLIDAISNGGSAAESYNASNAIKYIWDEVRYSTFSDQIIATSLTNLVDKSRISFNAIYGETGLQSLKQEDDSALQTFLNPIGSSSENIQATSQGVRQFLNTISVAMMILQQFFLVMGPNIISLGMGVYKRMTWQRLAMIRFIYAIICAFFSGLTIAGYYWAFRETWAVNGNQFVLTWMTLWLVTLIYHLFLYAVSCLIPVLYMPIVLITWIFVNLTSSASPFDLNPYFYRWGYALPAYNAYQIFTDIWSGGQVRALYRALPILFSWLVALSVMTCFAHRRMCTKLMNAPPPPGAAAPQNPREKDEEFGDSN